MCIIWCNSGFYVIYIAWCFRIFGGGILPGAHAASLIYNLTFHLFLSPLARLPAVLSILFFSSTRTPDSGFSRAKRKKPFSGVQKYPYRFQRFTLFARTASQQFSFVYNTYKSTTSVVVILSIVGYFPSLQVVRF